MNNGSVYFISRIDPSSFKASSTLAKHIIKDIAFISFLLFWVDAGAQELSWNEKFGSYSNVTAQFNISSSPAGLGS